MHFFKKATQHSSALILTNDEQEPEASTHITSRMYTCMHLPIYPSFYNFMTPSLLAWLAGWLVTLLHKTREMNRNDFCV